MIAKTDALEGKLYLCYGCGGNIWNSGYRYLLLGANISTHLLAFKTKLLGWSCYECCNVEKSVCLLKVVNSDWFQLNVRNSPNVFQIFYWPHIPSFLYGPLNCYPPQNFASVLPYAGRMNECFLDLKG